MTSSVLRRASRISWVCLAVVAAWAQEARAGAWTQPQGVGFVRLAVKEYFAPRYFDADGVRTPGDWWSVDARYDETSANLIVEYGLLDRLTLALDTTAKAMHSTYPTGNRGDIWVVGLSDVGLGARYGIWQKTLVLAIEARAEIPTGYHLFDDRVRLGNGWVNGQLRALFGGSLPLGISNYFDSGFGYRLRGGPYADDLVASLSIGVETFKNLWVRLGSSAVFNLGDSHASGQGQPADASYLSAGGAVTYVFESGFGVEVAASADLWGKNTFAGWGIEAVVQYKFPALEKARLAGARH